MNKLVIIVTYASGSPDDTKHNVMVPLSHTLLSFCLLSNIDCNIHLLENPEI